MYENKKAAKLINFIQYYGIESFENLHKAVDEMYYRLYYVRRELKTAELRLNELGIILEEADIYQKNKAVYDKSTNFRTAVL